MYDKQRREISSFYRSKVQQSGSHFSVRKCRTLVCESVALQCAKVDSVVVWGRLLQGVDKWCIEQQNGIIKEGGDLTTERRFTMSKFTIDIARGFDVITKAGKVVEHFHTYEAATAYARARRMTVRSWAVSAEEKGE